MAYRTASGAPAPSSTRLAVALTPTQVTALCAVAAAESGSDAPGPVDGRACRALTRQGLLVYRLATAPGGPRVAPYLTPLGVEVVARLQAEDPAAACWQPAPSDPTVQQLPLFTLEVEGATVCGSP